jgi:hypothetical protein
MAVITDYASVTQAISDFCHRQDLQTGLYTDYFLQGAIEKIQDDTFAANFGNGVRFMENAYPPYAIQGTAPLPTDWLSPKAFQIQDGSGAVFTLIFKAAAWIYDQYPLRQSSGLPAYIARDVMAPCAFTASIASGILNVSAVASGILQPGMIITGVGFPSGIQNSVTITGQNSGATGGIGLYPISNSTLTIASEAMTGGGNVFVFGPYPDGNYTLQGTYYQNAPLLNAGTTTNWMVANQPAMLHAAAMLKAGEFLVDDALIARWTPIYEGRMASFILKDKAERWASSVMSIDIG